MWNVTRFVAVAGIVLASASGAQALYMETVAVGNPGNAPDTRYATPGYGGVDHLYEIGRCEVTAGQYTEFLNAVAATDTYGLYSSSMWGSGYGCKIQRSGSAGSYTYSVALDWVDRPVNYVSWGDAARFTNWLHNGQPTGAQGLDTTEDGSYVLNGATSDGQLMAVTRKPDATWVIPLEDEWYKAAYHKNNGVTGNYWDYPTATDAVPSNDLIAPDPGNNANFHDFVHDEATIGSPYWRTEVGEFENSLSAYGTFDQGGNLWEWDETSIYGAFRGTRGGAFTSSDANLLAANRSIGYEPVREYPILGFRVAQLPELPEPTTLSLLALGGGLALLRRPRR